MQHDTKNNNNKHNKMKEERDEDNVLATFTFLS